MREGEIDDRALTPRDPAEAERREGACPECDGAGTLPDGEVCPLCDGSGRANSRVGGG